jgi:hypothetical protein
MLLPYYRQNKMAIAESLESVDEILVITLEFKQKIESNLNDTRRNGQPPKSQLAKKST